MITIVVNEDEKTVYRLLSEALREAGYSFIDEPESGGIIKIIKRNGSYPSAFEGSLGLQNLLLKAGEGELYKTLLSEVEKHLIESVLRRVEGNQLKAARILGINRNTLRAKMKKLGIKARSWKK
jgi:transcriptional regulator with AAA-type ATPase domain